MARIVDDSGAADAPAVPGPNLPDEYARIIILPYGSLGHVSCARCPCAIHRPSHRLGEVVVVEGDQYDDMAESDSGPAASIDNPQSWDSALTPLPIKEVWMAPPPPPSGMRHWRSSVSRGRVWPHAQAQLQTSRPYWEALDSLAMVTNAKLHRASAIAPPPPPPPPGTWHDSEFAAIRFSAYLRLGMCGCSAVTSIACSAGGDMVYSTAADGVFRVYSVPQQEQVRRYESGPR
jgi:hypothetical protein